MKLLNSVEIPRRSVNCSHKGEALTPGMEIVSLIRELEEQNFARSDYCQGCWQEIYPLLSAQTDRRGYWKTTIEPRKPASDSPRPIRALSLLKELLANRDSHLGEIFILAIFLARARLIALRQEFQQEGILYQLYEIVRQEEFITVQVVNLPQIQIEGIQQSLARKLSA